MLIGPGFLVGSRRSEPACQTSFGYFGTMSTQLSGGMSTNMYAAQIAGRVAIEAIEEDDLSKEKLYEYEGWAEGTTDKRRKKSLLQQIRNCKKYTKAYKKKK